MRKKLLLSDKPIESMNSEEYLESIKKLYKPNETKASRSIADLTITWGKKSTIIRFKRTIKTLELREVEQLGLEYDKSVEELLELFMIRKIKVIDEKGICLNEPEPKQPKVRKTKKRDDELQVRRSRKTPRKDKLLEPGANAGLQEESTL